MGLWDDEDVVTLWMSDLDVFHINSPQLAFTEPQHHTSNASFAPPHHPIDTCEGDAKVFHQTSRCGHQEWFAGGQMPAEAHSLDS